MRDVFFMAVSGEAKFDDSSGEGHTSETLELRLNGRARELKLSLVERLVPTVRTGVDDIEPDLFALAAESRGDVGAVAAVVVTVNGAVAVLRAFDSDSEIGVRLEGVVSERIEVVEHCDVRAKLEDEVACVAHLLHLLAALLAGPTVHAEYICHV